MLNELSDHEFRRKPFLNDFSAGRPQLFRGGRIPQESQNPVSRGGRIFTFDKIPVMTFFDCFGIPSYTCRHARQNRRPSLRFKALENPLTPGRKEENISHLKQREDIFGLSEKSEI